MTISRRSLVTGLATFLAAPAIVRAGSLMPVKSFWDGDLIKATERFLTGSHGSVAFTSATYTDPAFTWNIVGAAEQIWTGDLIAIRDDGYAYPVRATDLTRGLEGCGVALTNSAPSERLRRFTEPWKPNTEASTSQPSGFGLRRIHP
jgi:hypothetical protein